MPGYRKILVAVDFSRDTEHLCRKGAELATRFQSELCLVHVVEPPVIEPAYDVMPPLPLGLESEMLARSRKELIRLGDAYGVPAERCWVETGNTKLEILELAAREGVELIVVGSHGRHGIRLLLGSTANAVLNSAKCDVLSVRMPG